MCGALGELEPVRPVLNEEQHCRRGREADEEAPAASARPGLRSPRRGNVGSCFGAIVIGSSDLARLRHEFGAHDQGEAQLLPARLAGEQVSLQGPKALLVA
jgi:hypothetical protein